MEINISNQCSEDENEVITSNGGQASKQPETMSSSNDAKHDKVTTTTSSVYARTFVSVQSFKTRDEFLSAMIEDVTEWLNSLFNLDIKSHELMHHLDTGVLLCRLANILEGLMVDEKRDPDDADRGTPAKSKDEGGVGRGATSDDVRRSVATRPLVAISGNSGGSGGGGVLVFRENASRGSFQSRDNISNFLNWCRNRLKLADTVLFETEDLVAGRNERNVILCLLEVARRGSKHGMIVPELIELETEIDAELDEESMAEDEVEVERLAQEVEDEEEEDDDDDEETDDDDDQSDGSEMEQANSASDLGAPCEAAVAAVAAEEKEGSIEEVSEAMVSALLEGSRNEVELTNTDRNGPEVTTSDRNDLKLTTSYLVSSGATAGSSSPRAGLCLRLHDLLRMHEHRRSEIQRCMRHSIQVDMLTLDELVRRFLGNCRCQHPYPMIKISEGKYRVGDNLMLIFVRMLRNHVMLRIGGGWETLADYLKRHDPCRATSDEHHRRGATHTCTHAILENAPWNDDTTIHSNVTSGTPSDISTPVKRENMQERDEDKSTEEDKDKTEKGKTAQEKQENAPEDEEMHETTDSTTKQQEQTLNGSTEKHISA